MALGVVCVPHAIDVTSNPDPFCPHVDYSEQPLLFKLRKAARYARLYGVARTWIKIRGQYHMKRVFTTLPVTSTRRASKQQVGIIGCGNFAYSNIAYYLTKSRGPVIKGCMDTNLHRAVSLCRDFGAGYFTDDVEVILSDPDIQLVYVASNHASHADYAIRALLSGKAVHIEKPHVVSHEQLRRLCETMQRCGGKVGLGFNRPLSRFGREIARLLREETSPLVMNWFVAGHEIPPDHWYFRDEEGGRVLGNLCHWTDFALRMVPRDRRYPIQIIPTRGQRSDCNIAVTYIFGDGSIAAITFSAMGHTFEGVRERMSLHCGNLLVRLEDFHSMVVEKGPSRRKLRSTFRDHGHADAILGTFDAASGSPNAANNYALSYVWETGDLFLTTKLALDTNSTQTVTRFSAERLASAATP